jgi:hypothetical protein
MKIDCGVVAGGDTGTVGELDVDAVVWGSIG